MTPAEFESLPYRPCVGIILLNPAGLVWIGRRADEDQVEHVSPGHAWQMPQGGIDPGEDPFEAAKRELWEETNVKSATLLAEAPDWYGYDIPREVVGERWKFKWRGQTQKWFAFCFLGPDSEIDILRPGGGAFTAEFDAWDWLPLTELPGRVVAFKRPIYEALTRAFARFAG